MSRLPWSCLLSCVLLASLPAVAWAADDQVTIYRCIGSEGRISLQDSPCEPGQRQQARAMQRPQDPPPVNVTTPAAVPAPAPAQPLPQPPRRVVQATPSRPMYECATPDGELYSSDTDEGNPRWVPFWTLGYAAAWPRGGGHPPGPGPRPAPGQGPHGGAVGVVVPAGGTWVRDECHALPQTEVCARLADRRYEILRRYNSVMPSERRQLELEQRGIDARMNNDCGGT